jgi:hypothetical protein
MAAASRTLPGQAAEVSLPAGAGICPFLAGGRVGQIARLIQGRMPQTARRRGLEWVGETGARWPCPQPTETTMLDLKGPLLWP